VGEVGLNLPTTVEPDPLDNANQKPGNRLFKRKSRKSKSVIGSGHQSTTSPPAPAKNPHRFSLQKVVGELDANSPIRSALHQLIHAPSPNKQTIVSLVNHKTKSGDTPLHYCCNSKSPYEGIILLLLENGALVDILNKNGESPLHLLILNRNVTSATFLATINSLSENNFESKDNYLRAPFKELSCVVSPDFIKALVTSATAQPDPQKAKIVFLNELLGASAKEPHDSPIEESALAASASAESEKVKDNETVQEKENEEKKEPEKEKEKEKEKTEKTEKEQS